MFTTFSSTGNEIKSETPHTVAQVARGASVVCCAKIAGAVWRDARRRRHAFSLLVILVRLSDVFLEFGDGSSNTRPRVATTHEVHTILKELTCIICGAANRAS